VLLSFNRLLIGGDVLHVAHTQRCAIAGPWTDYSLESRLSRYHDISDDISIYVCSPQKVKIYKWQTDIIRGRGIVI